MATTFQANTKAEKFKLDLRRVRNSLGEGNGDPLQYFGHLMQRVDSLEKTLMLGGIGGRRRRG